MPENDISPVEKAGDLSPQTIEELARQETFEAFGEGWEPAADFDNTTQRIYDALTVERPNNPPAPIAEFECRIGASKFFIPPLSISVNQRFRAGSMVGGALRQQNTPKFSTGNTETVIQMTLYFPTVETVWGTDRTFEVNFDDEEVPDERIDHFLGSLRGLIAQFKYAPFLPVKNAYLNQVFNITGVALKDMSVSTVPGFPFCMAVTLTLYKFNHKVFLPMVDDFDQAIHWGRFRQYMGRAISRIQNLGPVRVAGPDHEIGSPQGDIEPSVKTAEEILKTNAVESYSTTLFGLNTHTASRFDLYFPFYTPAEVELPDLSDLRYKPIVQTRSRNWWETLLSTLGFNPAIYEESSFDSIQNAVDKGETYLDGYTDSDHLYNYLNSLGIAIDSMGPAQLDGYLDQKFQDTGIDPGSNAGVELRARTRGAWFQEMYRMFVENPTTAAVLANEDKRRRHLTIDEWEVPMWRLGGQEGLNPNYVTVQGVSITMGNVLARLQLQMQDEPTHQHIGGEDTRIEISLLIHGDRAEEYLVKFRNMFDSITGLARLEHAHGVLGFLGIRSPLTDLVGVRHVVPINFSVDTVENFPHVYQVTLSLVDFDVFQQKREQLSAEQQAQIVDAMGKRNPMLRVKQLWGMFNAYPDFPLAVRDDDGRVVGHLDPDYYFRAFKAIDDDVVDSSASSENLPKMGLDTTLRDAIDRLHANDPPSENSVLDKVFGDGNFLREPGTHVSFGSVDGNPQYVSVDDDGITVRDGSEKLVNKMPIPDLDALTSSKTSVDGVTPSSGYVEHYAGGGADPRVNFDLMAKDMQYRDKSGRMVRAFPTYMLWLIDEGGNFAGMKMFNNFYGLQSVIDMSIVRSEDIMADTLILRVSNLYSKLTTEFQDYLNEDDFSGPSASMINQLTTRQLRLASGIADYLVDLETIRIKPGVRLHLKLGYGSNPNTLETVFNGTITEVQEGDIMTLVAQSDAVELGTLVNNTNEKGHTGKIDGTLTGLYMSEPRDLMISLLTQGSSVVKETLAHATQGQIFSENRYGIRHFGTMIYTPMTEEEQEKVGRQKRFLSNRILGIQEVNTDVANNVGGALPDNGAGQVAAVGSGRVAATAYSFVAVVQILNDAFVNLSTRRDYELFKRNIYPGNGTGVAQFLGGDFGDLVLDSAIDGSVQTTTGVRGDGSTTVKDPLSGGDLDVSAIDQLAGALNAQANGDEEAVVSFDEDTSQFTVKRPPPPNAAFSAIKEGVGRLNMPVNPAFATPTSGLVFENFMETLGIKKDRDLDDDGAFDEVAFRAQTYMKSVWDLFRLCAALLPDYIVAVRPFEDRSTVFYGKPHWLYTSGLVPLTTGPYPDGAVAVEGPNQEYEDIYRRLEQEYARRDEVFKNDILGAARAMLPGSQDGFTSDPTLSTDGMVWTDNPDSLLNASFASTTRSDGASELPYASGTVGIEMHVPTSEDLQQDIVNQAPSNAGLPGQYHHPFYMDRKGGPRGGEVAQKDLVPFDPQKSPLDYTHLPNEDPNTPGEPSYMSQVGNYLDPESERWYMCQYWNETDWAEGFKWRGERILLYRADTKQGVVCTPGDKGPHPDAPVDAGCSPEAFMALGQPDHSVIIHFRVLPRDYPLGPVKFDASGMQPSGGTSGSVSQSEEPVSRNEDAELPDWAVGEDSIKSASLEKGATVQGIPVNYTHIEDTPSGPVVLFTDLEGQKATAVYQKNRTDEQANQIWDEIRARFPTDAATRRMYLKNHPDYKDMTDDEKEEQVTDEEVEEVAIEFLRVMWQDGALRGWAPYVVSPLPDLGGVPGTALDFVRGGAEWDLDRLFSAFGSFVGAINGDPAEQLKAYAQNNQQPGLDSSHALGQVLENTARTAHSALDKVGQLVSSLTNIGSGIFNYVRFSMFQMTQGLSQANDMQAKANTLNAMYNDSIYYSAGIGPEGMQNPLLYYADNPFTREYGEPVAEIREPFQRMHMIGSFNHIINNGIIESLDDVATVITAVSNGSDPVTVHFDKGIPSERQFEKTIETGLFYDDPGFWGNLNPLNWLQQARETSLKSQGSSPELSAKRIALWHLKENLKNIYQGELMIIGDPSIRPYDLVYMADSYEKMYGFFEVEQVVHHFTPETGFVTTLTPNACVTINDPGRFYLVTRHKYKNDIQTMRDRLRSHYKVRMDATGTTDPNAVENDEISIDRLAQEFEDTMRGSVQYHGGSSKIVKTLTSTTFGLGAITGGQAAGVAGAAFLGPIGGILAWKGWEWVRDNLLDQHGCYISYLTKNGDAMDASLSYAEGVAVGHQHSMSLILGGLKLTEIEKTDAEGNPKIRIQDVVKSLQWTEEGPNDLAKELSLFQEATLFELRQMSGRYGDLVANDGAVEAYLGEIYNVVDADTFDIRLRKALKFGQVINYSEPIGRIRLSGANAPENPFKHLDIDDAIERYPNNAGVVSTKYAHDILLNRTVAIRINSARSRDTFGRTVAHVFHSVPENISHQTQRDAYLLNKAGSIPLASWDSYTSDGQPLTFDWQLITAGHGELETRELNYNQPGVTRGDRRGDTGGILP